MKANERPYDIAMSDEARVAVRARRAFPSGRCLFPRVTMRGDTEVLHYPWDEMALGDFFFVPLRGQKPGAMSIRLRQAAARRDWELTIVQWKEGSEHGLRVSLTLFDVSEYKAKAQHHHGAKNIRYSDGKWSETRKARYRRHKGSPKLRVVKAPREKPHQERDSGPTHQIVTGPEQKPVEIDASLSPNYDRAAVIKERLAALGIKS